jgi:hypothetical protein
MHEYIQKAKENLDDVEQLKSSKFMDKESINIQIKAYLSLAKQWLKAYEIFHLK